MPLLLPYQILRGGMGCRGPDAVPGKRIGGADRGNRATDGPGVAFDMPPIKQRADRPGLGRRHVCLGIRG